MDARGNLDAKASERSKARALPQDYIDIALAFTIAGPMRIMASAMNTLSDYKVVVVLAGLFRVRVSEPSVAVVAVEGERTRNMQSRRIIRSLRTVSNSGERVVVMEADPMRSESGSHSGPSRLETDPSCSKSGKRGFFSFRTLAQFGHSGPYRGSDSKI